MMALKKPYPAKNPQAIPDDILMEMVNTCAGDREQIFTKAKQYTIENNHEIILAKRFAEKGLLKKHGYLKQAKEDNLKVLSDIDEIIEALSILQNKLPAIPDFDDAINVPERSLAMRLMDHHIYAIDNLEYLQGIRKFGSKETFQKLIDWHEFLYLLEYHVEVFQDIQSTLSSLIKRGAPNTVEMLTGFIHHVARMYTAATGEKFTVSEYGDVYPYTKGMLFAQQSMAVLRVPNSIAYTKDSFHIACKRAAARENKLKRNKSKTL